MKVSLKIVVCSFPTLTEYLKDNSKFKKYSATFIFDEDSEAHKNLLSAAETVGSEKWRDKWPSIKQKIKLQGDWFVHDGAEREDKMGYSGRLFVNSSNPNPPVVKIKNDLAEKDSDILKIYGGAIVNAVVDVWAQDNPKYPKKIIATLLGVQFVKDGERHIKMETVGDQDFEEFDIGDDEAEDLL